MQAFFSKYKVFLFGIFGAIVTAIAGVQVTQGADFTIFVMPVIIGVVGFIGTTKRGQWSTIIGIVLVTAWNAYQASKNGQKFEFTAVDFQNLLLQFGVLYGFIAMPPIKDRAYEHDPIIEAAKSGESVSEEAGALGQNGG